MKRSVVLIMALSLIVVASRSAAASSHCTSADQNGNGVAESWACDDSGDGFSDRLIIDGNEDGTTDIDGTYTARGERVVVVWIDTHLDGRWDLAWQPLYANQGTGAMVQQVLWHDFDQNGLWENRYHDGQLDGVYEWVMVDTNFDGVADTWRGNAAPAGRSATDAMARQAASVGAVNILHAAGIPVFFSASTIPMGG